MAVHTTDAQSTEPTVAAPFGSGGGPHPRTAPVPLSAAYAQRPGATHRPTPRRLDGVRAAASVMGWVLWILLVLTTAALLTFAPSML